MTFLWQMLSGSTYLADDPELYVVVVNLKVAECYNVCGLDTIYYITLYYSLCDIHRF